MKNINKFILLFALAVAVSGVMCNISFASIIDLSDFSSGSSELRLHDIYNNVFHSTYTTNDQIEPLENDSLIKSGVFGPGEYKVSLIGRYAGAMCTLGYRENKVNYKIFDNLPGECKYYDIPLEVTFTATNNFRLWGEGEWSEGDSLGRWRSGVKYPNKYHFIFLNTDNANKFFVGFEDLRCGDWDYNDSAFLIEKVTTPEPATMSLLGLGLFGLLRFKRKRK